MSIDYDRLRELAEKASHGPWEVEEFEEQYTGCPGVTKFYLGSEDMQNIAVGEATDRHYAQAENNFALITLAPDMARELLALRDGIEVIRDYCAGVTTARRSSGDPATEVIARELGAVDRTLADLLNGDTE